MENVLSICKEAIPYFYDEICHPSKILKAHPNNDNMKTKTFEAFEDLQVIFESATARGNNAFGLGGDATAEAFEVENDVQEREDVNHMEKRKRLNQVYVPKVALKAQMSRNCTNIESQDITMETNHASLGFFMLVSIRKVVRNEEGGESIFKETEKFHFPQQLLHEGS
ncbi:hypothetical protein YC2023_114539 [Brassica napus]